MKTVAENKPQVLALSGFLSVAFDSMKSTIEAMEAASLRKDLKVIIGDGQMDDTLRRYTEADAYGVHGPGWALHPGLRMRSAHHCEGG